MLLVSMTIGIIAPPAPIIILKNTLPKRSCGQLCASKELDRWQEILVPGSHNLRPFNLDVSNSLSGLTRPLKDTWLINIWKDA